MKGVPMCRLEKTLVIAWVVVAVIRLVAFR